MGWLLQSGFGFGETSPSLRGRTETRAMTEGNRIAENLLFGEYGSARKRPGFALMREVSGPGRLFFWQARGDNHVVHLYDQTIDVLDMNGTPIASFSSPYLANELDGVYQGSVLQSKLILCHESYFTRVLDLDPQGDFSFGFYQFERPPILDERFKTIRISPRPVSGSEDPQFSAPVQGVSYLQTDTDFFTGRDVGSFFRYQNNFARVTEFISRREVQVSVSTAFPTDGSSLEWMGPFIPDSPTAVPVSVVIGSPVTTPFFGGSIATVNAPSHGLTAKEVGEVVVFSDPVYGWVHEIVDDNSFRVVVVGGGLFVGNTFSNFTIFRNQERKSTDGAYLMFNGSVAPGAGPVNLYSNKPIFSEELLTPGEPLPVFQLHNGLVEITSVAGPHQATGNVTSRLAKVGPDPTWGQSISRRSGYPTCVTEHQNRVILGGFKGFSNLLACSRTNNANDFSTGGVDDDGFVLKLSSDRHNQIVWLKSTNDLMVGTEENEHAISGALTTRSAGTSRQHSYGGRNIPPEEVGTAVLFVTRGSEVREMSFHERRGGYLAPDVTHHAKHLFPVDNPVVEMSFAREPEPLVVARLANGEVRVMTYRNDEDQGAIGWSPWKGLTVTGVTTVLGSNQDVLWAIIRVNGRHFLVRQDQEARHDLEITTQVVDGTSVEDLGDFEGMTVHVSLDSDEVDLGSYIVSNGAVSISPGFEGDDVRVGLPIVARLSPNVLDQADRLGAQFFRNRTVNAVNIFLNESRGGTLGRGSALLDYRENEHAAPFTGVKPYVGANVSGRDEMFTITHEDATHFEVIAVNIENASRGHHDR